MKQLIVKETEIWYLVEQKIIYINEKKRLRDNARDKYRYSSEEEKKQKVRIWKKEEKKQKLKEYHKIIMKLIKAESQQKFNKIMQYYIHNKLLISMIFFLISLCTVLAQ